MRLCLATRGEHPKTDMIRFGLSPDGVVVPDVSENLPGRGVWVMPDRALVRQAMEKGLFSKGFEQKAAAPADLVEQTERVLSAQALNMLGLGKRSGAVVSGFEKVKHVLNNQTAALIIEAKDTSVGSRDKLYRVEEVPVVRVFTSVQMDQVLGGENIKFAAVFKSKIGTQIKNIMLKLSAFQNGKE